MDTEVHPTHNVQVGGILTQSLDQILQTMFMKPAGMLFTRAMVQLLPCA